MDIIKIEKPILNRSTPEANIAVIDRWIADTADKLNYFMEQMKGDSNGNDGDN